MDKPVIFYFDDALAREKKTIESTTLRYLQSELPGAQVVGFGSHQPVLRYFYNFNNYFPNLLILDYNLFWHKDGDFIDGYQFRYSHQLLQELNSIRGKILELPKIIFSDDPNAETNYKSAGIPYSKFIPKWGESPWNNLLRETKQILELPGSKERYR